MALTRPMTPKTEKVNEIEPLRIVTLGDLERRLRVVRVKLHTLVDNAQDYYAPYLLEKPQYPFSKKKKPPKVRLIDRPIKDLVDLQSRIYYGLLRNVELPKHICGGVKGRSVLTNVAHHLNAPLIVSLDIKDFFPSITAAHVRRVWRNVLKCSRQVSNLLTSLTTVDNHLPQGSPVSTALSNLVLYSIDRDIRRAALQHGVVYSTYVDDLTFSGPEARELIPIVIATLRAFGFRISRSKLKVMSARSQKIVNGVVVGNRPSLPKQRRKQLRAAFHRLPQIRDEDGTAYLASLKGRVMYAASVNADQAAHFRIALIDVEAARQ